MTVHEAMSQSIGLSPENGMIGRAWKDWCDVGTTHVLSGTLTAVDFGVHNPSSGLSIAVPPGPYRVQARIMSFGGSLGICAARALPNPDHHVSRGPPLGKVSIDFAKLTIADITTAFRDITREDSRCISRAMRGIVHECGAIVTMNLTTRSITLPCIATGFGDGKYPAFPLLHNATTVGIEIEFVPDGHVYDRTPSTTDPREILRRLDSLRPPSNS